VVASAVTRSFFSYAAPTLSIAIGAVPLLAIYAVLFSSSGFRGLLKGLIERVRIGLLPGNGLWIAAAILLGLGVAVMVAVIGNPVRFPTALATIAIVCIGVGFWSLASTIVLVVLPRRFRLPSSRSWQSRLVAIFERSNDDRIVRVCQAWEPPCTAGVTAPASADIRSPFDLSRTNVENWIGHVCPHAGRACPMIFAAGEGGGLRAAYWTASVLSELNQSTQGRLLSPPFCAEHGLGSSLGATCGSYGSIETTPIPAPWTIAELNPGDANPAGSKTCADRLSTFRRARLFIAGNGRGALSGGFAAILALSIPQFGSRESLRSIPGVGMGVFVWRRSVDVARLSGTLRRNNVRICRRSS